MNSNLLRFKKNKKFIVFDYETCSLNLASLDNKPWQLAFLICSHDKIEKKYDFYLRWNDLKISDGAKQVTGFKESVYQKRATDPLEVLNLFESYIYNPDYYIVGHNIIGFDIFIHNIHRLLCGKRSDYSYVDRLIDTNCIAKANALDIEYDETDLTLWQFKLQKIKKRGLKTNLKSLCEKFKIDFDENKLHDALYDIEQNFKVFKSMIWKSNI
jgi:DNA polymerase III epsilon subunit-like protein